MIPLQVHMTGSGPAEVGRQKIYVSFESEAEMKRGVEASRNLGGMKFLGVATEPRTKILFAVFESENDASKLMADILAQGVRIKSVVVKGMTEAGPVVRGLAPVVVRCEGCGAAMLYDTHFSTSGMQYCDACLKKMIEEPSEKEGP